VLGMIGKIGLHALHLVGWDDHSGLDQWMLRQLTLLEVCATLHHLRQGLVMWSIVLSPVTLVIGVHGPNAL